jgi:peroxiredoxin
VSTVEHLRLSSAQASAGLLERRTIGYRRGLELGRAREHARRAAGGLVGRAIPALNLMTSAGTPFELSCEMDEAAVLYVFPGAASSDCVAADGAQHRAFDRHREDLRERSLKVFGLSSESERSQRLRVLEHRVCHTLVSDPQLQLGRALELPTFTDEGTTCYRRLTIVAVDGRIVKAFFPVESPQRSASQVLCWLTATGHW